VTAFVTPVIKGPVGSLEWRWSHRKKEGGSMSRQIRRGGSLAFVFVVGAAVVAHAQPCEPGWEREIGQPGIAGSGGSAGSVETLAVFDDGSGPALYAAGSFTHAGGVPAANIAKWDGVSWSSLSVGTNEIIFALAVFDDGDGDALYAGGSFTRAGGVPATSIAKWNGTSWSAVNGGTSGVVHALAVFNDGAGPALYAGGTFTQAGGLNANYIAKWTGTNWRPLGGGTNLSVSALAVYTDAGGTALYVGGDFTAVGATQAAHVAKWTGSAWEPLGAGVNDLVMTLVGADEPSAVGPALYAGGNFTSASGWPASYIARWNGNFWLPLSDGVNFRVLALDVFNDGTGLALFAGGKFTEAGGVEANHIAKWDGLSWSPLGNGTNDDVLALTHSHETTGIGTRLYVGGRFTEVDGGPASGIAAWGADCIVGDCDGDQDMDLDDYSRFPGCMLGPNGGLGVGCECVDLNGNRHVDLRDAKMWQHTFAGAR
jgi:hypothetical protein